MTFPDIQKYAEQLKALAHPTLGAAILAQLAEDEPIARKTREQIIKERAGSPCCIP